MFSFCFPENGIHTDRQKDIGWNEYFVTFQGEYFNKLLNKIFQPLMIPLSTSA